MKKKEYFCHGLSDYMLKALILTMANGDFSENLATVWGFRLPSKWAHWFLG
jgi:hypothetical protein